MQTHIELNYQVFKKLLGHSIGLKSIRFRWFNMQNNDQFYCQGVNVKSSGRNPGSVLYFHETMVIFVKIDYPSFYRRPKKIKSRWITNNQKITISQNKAKNGNLKND